MPVASLAQRLETGSRIVVVLSAGAALAFQVWLGARVWPALPLICALAAGVSAALAARAPRIGWTVGALLLCVAPSLLPFSLRDVGQVFLTPYLAGLLGLTIGATRWRGWALPALWRTPLVLWSLSVALVWPVIAARETGFMWPLLFDGRVSVTALGVSPAVQIVWILNVVLTHLVGILWLDALFRTFGDRSPEHFEHHVVLPLICGAVVSASVGVVQTLYDATLLNQTQYGAGGRAAGLLLDGNVFGVTTAMAAAAAGAIALRQGGRRAAVWALAACTVIAMAVWGSGSRTSLAVLIAGSLPIAAGFWYTRVVSRRVLATATGVILATMVIVAQSSAVVGPLQRLRRLAGPEPSVSGLVERLWHRDRYGTYAHRMIVDEPLIGVGIGMFHSLASDYSMMDRGRRIAPDNAQNWFRHNLAEMGLLGCAGWLWWLVVFLRGLKRSGPPENRWPRRIILGSLTGLAFASLLGMPTQHIAALLVMWTLVCWHTRLGTLAPETPRRPRRTALVVWLVALSFVGLTARAAVSRLQVPERALRAEWGYEQGFSPIDDPDVPRGTRWLAGRASAVVHMRREYLVLRLWTPEPVAGSVRILRNGRVIATLTPDRRRRPVLYVRKPDGADYMRLDFRVTSTTAMSPIESSGVAIGAWRTVSTVPPGAMVVE